MQKAQQRTQTLMAAAVELYYMALENPRVAPIFLGIARALEDIAETEREASRLRARKLALVKAAEAPKAPKTAKTARAPKAPKTAEAPKAPKAVKAAAPAVHG